VLGLLDVARRTYNEIIDDITGEIVTDCKLYII